MILQGPVGLSSCDVSFGQYVLAQLQKFSTRVLLVEAKEGRELTNQDILDQSIKLARALDQRRVKLGDTVAICSENSFNWLIAALGTIYTGASLAPINPAYVEGELRHCLGISKPRVIFVSRRTEIIVDAVCKSLPWTVDLIQLDEKSTLEHVTTIADLIKYQRVPHQYQPVKVPQPAKQEVVILCSSGTTGLPKGVMLSHRNLCATLHALRTLKCTSLETNAIILILLPLFHGFGFAVLLYSITLGARAVLMESFEPQLFCQSIQKYRVSTVPLAPPLMVFLAKHPMVSQYNLSSLREIVCGAASLSFKVYEAVQRRLGPGVSIRNGYGMTELSVLTNVTPVGITKPESVGTLTPGTVCKIIEPTTSKSLRAYQTGELCFKGDHVMLGYRGDPEATGQTIDQDGWLHTGDLGYYDHDNHLFVVGRLKELIKYKGFQIAPAEIENILLSHPEVEDAAVIGKDCDEAGEIPVAFIVRKSGATISPTQLRSFVDAQVSSQKRLRGGVYVVKAIPKNPGGKILRKNLQQLISKL